MSNIETIHSDGVPRTKKMACIISVILFLVLVGLAVWAFILRTKDDSHSSTQPAAYESLETENCSVFTESPKLEGRADIALPVRCIFTVGENFEHLSFDIRQKDEEYAELSISDKNGLIQQIPIENRFYDQGNPSVWDAYFNIAQDYNLDGYKDIRVLGSLGASNMWFDYWMFNPQKGMFEQDLVLRGIPNPQFEEGKIVSTLLAGWGNGTTCVYEFSNGAYRNTSCVSENDTQETSVSQSKREFRGSYLAFSYPDGWEVEEDTQYGMITIRRDGGPRGSADIEYTIVRSLFERDSKDQPESFLLEYAELFENEISRRQIEVSGNLRGVGHEITVSTQNETAKGTMVLSVLHFKLPEPLNEYFDAVTLSGYRADTLSGTQYISAEDLKDIQDFFRSIRSI